MEVCNSYLFSFFFVCVCVCVCVVKVQNNIACEFLR